MPETGNNIEKKDKILSIRLSLNGLYFSVAEENQIIKHGSDETSSANGIGNDAQRLRQLLADNELTDTLYDAVEIALDTEKMVLIPSEAFSADLAPSYLKINGHELSENERAVCSHEVQQIVAAMAWDSIVIDMLTEVFGQQLRFSSPILNSIARQQSNSIEITKFGDRLYVTLHNSSLEFAECLPYSTIADTLYYIETLKKQFGMDKRTLYIYGDDAKVMANQLKQYYRRVTLREDN